MDIRGILVVIAFFAIAYAIGKFQEDEDDHPITKNISMRLIVGSFTLICVVIVIAVIAIVVRALSGL